MDSQSQLLPHLIEVLHQARKDSGVTWREFERAVEGEPFARERSNCLDLERRADGAGDGKYWPNLDAFVMCYAVATGKEPLWFWDQAVKRAKKATSQSPRSGQGKPRKQ